MARLAIRMPKMSMTMTEGEVNEWMVRVGDEIAEGDVVCEVMTDKVDMEVESTVSGTLVEIVVESGTVEVGEPIGWVEGEDTGGGFGDLLAAPTPEPEPAAAPVPDAAPEPVAATEPEAPASSGIVPAVPRARALARDNGVDLASVTPTGPDGLVRVEDVEQAVRPAAAPAPVAAPAAAPAPAPAPAVVATPAASAPRPTDDRRIAVRRAVARKMVPTAVIPQFTVWRQVHLDTANAVRNGVSWTTVLLRAYAAALRDVPELLSRWEDDAPTEAGPPAIALAVATERGLMVPTFTEPDARPIADVDAEVRSVVARVQKGKLDPAYMGVANGSLSNLGGLGVDQFQALLTPPQASVLSLGTITQRPVAVPGGLGVALTVNAGLTVDHRVADGAHGAQLLEAFSKRLSGGL
ncbi:pyruvate dehydrogenase E2 component (dihydrolipoamide acetyltransferase) [Nocardioides exalbidus]|uniref:Dihydrolipoamide acetyltransferase component of pyruvate dehydrogenase complex n=1 Tax=Nocardioides exalbidus TaxID=402596 RepID=A0A1H4SAK2_9ACTN|nr:dihydrolipoamide acetyltransferase family protein [Nocardioides exalbidus]SEC41077.1 pyruvate dehydrogenase E2 component (dihydrolipoamide acetyltransferase) [Nocardioides exalbidus]